MADVLPHDAGSSEVRRLRAELFALRQVPREQARALSAAFYTSREYLDFERQALFRTQWICIGHVGAIPTAGDYFTTELVGEQLLIVRDSSTVRVLSNVCRHRGSPVAQGAGHAARFVCSYHGWTYALDGRLLAAPLIQDGKHFSKASCRLPQFASEIWEGYIFVNLDGSAAPLVPTLSPAIPFIKNYHPADQHFLFEAQEVWQTNWKCLVENFMEGYHLSPLHAKTLHPVTPTKLCEKLPDGDSFTGYRANFHPECPERGPYHADLTPQERRSDVFYCVYPSFVVGFCPHFTLYMCIRPLTADSVGIRWGVTGIADDPGSPVVESYIRFCKEFCAEDRMQLERLQCGLNSLSYVPGPLGPDHVEGTVWDIIQYMARRLGQAATTAPAASIDSRD
jgi:nitrite reductase/ring-hydroxylating ferredoxin subunit